MHQKPWNCNISCFFSVVFIADGVVLCFFYGWYCQLQRKLFLVAKSIGLRCSLFTAVNSTTTSFGAFSQFSWQWQQSQGDEPELSLQPPSRVDRLTVICTHFCKLMNCSLVIFVVMFQNYDMVPYSGPLPFGILKYCESDSILATTKYCYNTSFNCWNIHNTEWIGCRMHYVHRSHGYTFGAFYWPIYNISVSYLQL